MKVNLRNQKKASLSSIQTLEKLIGEPLDDKFAKFVLESDGAKPESNSFTVDGVEHMGGIDEFIPVKDIPKIRQHLDNLPKNAYPIALCSGGDLVVLDQERLASIYYWDHEVEEGLVKIAEDFDGFLDMIQPFDEASIQLQPSQVKSVWVDPDLLKECGN